VELTGEAMEVFGGNGYVEEGVMARLFREAPVNSIWEGSGNVMCLDVLRALAREPEAAAALLADLAPAAQGEPRLATALVTLGRDLATPGALNEAGARAVAQRLVLLVQACLLQQQAPAFVADAFFATRFAEPHWGRVVGAMDTRGMDVAALLERAFLTPQ
jgi:putative acyl-CoA dehydrogenase